MAPNAGTHALSPFRPEDESLEASAFARLANAI